MGVIFEVSKSTTFQGRSVSHYLIVAVLKHKLSATVPLTSLPVFMVPTLKVMDFPSKTVGPINTLFFKFARSGVLTQKFKGI